MQRRRRTRAFPIPCYLCRNSKTKCDGQRPYCTTCVERGLDCPGYEARLRRGVDVASRSQDLPSPIASSKLHGDDLYGMSASFGPAAEPPHIMPGDKAEAYDESTFASGSCDPGPSRGRTLEKVPSSSTYSRNSSASSARSMIDERMSWANEERSRSFSRPAPEPASPFRESSPHHPSHEKYRDDAWDVPPSLPLTETPATNVFNTQDSLDPMAERDRGMKLIDRKFRVLMEVGRHLHPDEVTHLERRKQSCAEQDLTFPTEHFAVRQVTQIHLDLCTA